MYCVQHGKPLGTKCSSCGKEFCQDCIKNCPMSNGERVCDACGGALVGIPKEQPTYAAASNGTSGNVVQQPVDNAVHTNQKKCPNCGAEYSTNFCPNCGYNPFQQNQQPIQQQYQQPSQQPINVVINNANTNSNINTNTGRAGTPKNKWTALLLCIFLGFLGAHKFYEGKAGMGILYLFTGGLFAIGVIIDLIVILSHPDVYYV